MVANVITNTIRPEILIEDLLTGNEEQFRVRKYRRCSSVAKEGSSRSGVQSDLGEGIIPERHFCRAVIRRDVLVPPNSQFPLHTLELLTAENAEIGAEYAEKTSIIRKFRRAFPAVTWLYLSLRSPAFLRDLCG
jgi:hypothetical protein